MKLLDIVSRVDRLTRGAPYAVIGGLAQILWARKTHTDNLDIALSSAVLGTAYERVASHDAEPGWTVPSPPDRVHDVYHLLLDGTVVDLLAFRADGFTEEIHRTAQAIPELGGVRFIRPELLLVTQLLRPGTRAAIAAIELVAARWEQGGIDVEYARRWAKAVGREPRLDQALQHAEALRKGS